jgi:tyrosyl-tRNA synthetase
VLPEGGLEAKLKQGRPLRVKLGIDVTSPDIHVGRAIPLQPIGVLDYPTGRVAWNIRPVSCP